MAERPFRLAPFISQFKHCPPEERTVKVPMPSQEWKEVKGADILVYKRKHGMVRIYKEVRDQDGKVTLEYLPYESLYYALNEISEAFPPIGRALWDIEDEW